MEHPTDTERFTRAFVMLAETFGKEISDRLPEIYFAALHDLSIDDVEGAIARAIGESRFFPKPIELRDLVVQSKDEHLISAEQAWGIVTSAFEKVGRYRQFPADTVGGELLKKVVDAIGWEQLCDSQNQDVSRAHFMRMFAGIWAADMRERARGRQPVPLYLPDQPPVLKLEPPESAREQISRPGRRHISELGRHLEQIGAVTGVKWDERNGGKVEQCGVDYEARKKELRAQAKLVAARDG